MRFWLAVFGFISFLDIRSSKRRYIFSLLVGAGIYGNTLRHTVWCESLLFFFLCQWVRSGVGNGGNWTGWYGSDIKEKGRKRALGDLTSIFVRIMLTIWVL